MIGQVSIVLGLLSLGCSAVMAICFWFCSLGHSLSLVASRELPHSMVTFLKQYIIIDFRFALVIVTITVYINLQVVIVVSLEAL